MQKELHIPLERTTTAAQMADDAVSASAKGASFLILVQIASKVLTFGLNQLLLRYLSPSLLGAAVQLELYKIGVLYFSRESLRVATERRSSGGVQVAVNLSYLAILAGLPFGYGFSRWFLHVGYPDVPLFVQALRVNQAAAFVELLSEPAFVTVQQKMLFKIRATAEVPGLMMKAFTTAALVFWGQQKGMELGVFPFACGELANSTTMTLLYLYRTSCVAKRDGFSLLPRKLNSRCVEWSLRQNPSRKRKDFPVDVSLVSLSLVPMNSAFPLCYPNLCSGSAYLSTSKPPSSGRSPKATSCSSRPLPRSRRRECMRCRPITAASWPAWSSSPSKRVPATSSQTSAVRRVSAKPHPVKHSNRPSLKQTPISPLRPKYSIALSDSTPSSPFPSSPSAPTPSPSSFALRPAHTGPTPAPAESSEHTATTSPY